MVSQCAINKKTTPKEGLAHTADNNIRQIKYPSPHFMLVDIYSPSDHKNYTGDIQKSNEY